MSHKELAKKQQEPLIEEEKDFYLSFLNKKIRNTKKKLEQIDELLKKDLETLKPEQLEKVNSRDEVLQTIKHHEELKTLYYNAYKISLEEGKAAPQSKTSEKVNKKASQTSKNETQITSEEDALEVGLKKLLELFAFSQLLENSNDNNAFQSAVQETEKSLPQNIPLSQLKQFCTSTLNFTSPAPTTIQERIQQSLNQIKPYIKSEGEFELQGEKYNNLHQAIHQTLHQYNSQSDSNNGNTTPNSNKSNEVGLPPSAVVLQNILQNSHQKPHKAVRFVDEIEKDLMSDKNKENQQSSSALESEKPASTEVTAPSTQQPEEEREQSGEEQEQKSFRKRRSYDSQDKPKTKSHNNQRYGGEGAKSHRNQENYYRGGGRNAGSKYQYTTTYYEKKSNE